VCDEAEVAGDKGKGVARIADHLNLRSLAVLRMHLSV